MLLNKFLFPAPKPPHYTAQSHWKHLFWIPADSPTDSPIPCMFSSPPHSNRKINYLIIFCHGNGCDIGSMQYTLSQFSHHLNVYTISFEYPSYGLCTAPSPNQQTINNHADRTFHFVRDRLHWPAERIIIYGHSIGSGVGCYLASNQPIAALILQSPYTSISGLVREKVSVLSYLVNSRSWDNLETMNNITCPILFIHGQDDTLIPASHSQVLHDACSNIEQNHLVILPKENHNSMSEITLLEYITPFVRNQSRVMSGNVNLPKIRIDEELRQQPENILASDSNGGIFSFLRSSLRASTSATMSFIQGISNTRTEEPIDNE